MQSLLAALNPEDEVSLDVPLLIRIMELSREEIPDDAALHIVATNLIELSKSGETLTMSDYDSILEGVPLKSHTS